MPKLKQKKPKKNKTSADCKKCQGLHRDYLDFSVGEDERLKLLGTLMAGLSGNTEIDLDTVISIGCEIEAYWQRKIVRESVFFGRSLKRCTLPDRELNAELQKARAHRNGLR